jgi:hypothetical protein
MTVRELVELLQKLPNQEATVVVGEGIKPDRWLLIIGLVERRIALANHNLDWVGPGAEQAVEIV